MVKPDIETDAAPRKAWHADGLIHVQLDDGAEIAFPVSLTERLAHATPAALANIRLLPFSLHWPELDEDLSIDSLLELGYGR